MEEKARVMARLNRRRSDIAVGLNDWPPAADMMKLRWVEELSREAHLWADQCRPPGNSEEYDVCRDLYSTTVGQCIASIIGEAPGLRPETMVDIWYMQRISYEGNFTSYNPPTHPSQYYGDFAQMVWSRTYMVGCGRSRFMALWRGRLRSVERLVCNFAPRGPVPARALWTPGLPSSMCPPRSRPDPQLPGLCTFHSDLTISDDTANITSLEENLLLDTVLDIENNDTLNYIESLDEIFLKKLAVANFDYITTDKYNNYINKRELVDHFEMNEVIIPVSETEATISIIEEKTTKRTKKNNIIGRPKSYNLEDLEELTPENIIRNDISDKTTDSKDLYADLDYSNDDNYGILVRGSMINSKSVNKEKTNVSQIATTFFEMSNITEEANVATSTNISSFMKGSGLVSNKTTKRDDLEDYLSDPETFRQLQEALERMENSLAVPTLTAGKVRRDLRTPPPNRTLVNRQRIPPEVLQAELERNKTLERGPMLNMVMKYLPYLKSYEKTLIGDGSTNSVARLMPNILAIILCM
ncbi:unnamed protein product [Leptosia nina]|uniref:SCP domain-containing protein n=1 Tax=Leptosia nina TaxID=320188 RepID=A0AAV1JCB5_9NEOP